jgi:hypothetical protein
LEETEDGHSNGDSPLRVNRPDVPRSVSPRTPDNIATRKCYSHQHGGNKPTAKISVEAKQLKRKSQQSEILSGTPYKKFIEGKGKEKASKIKGRAERQLKGFEAAQKKLKSGGMSK